MNWFKNIIFSSHNLKFPQNIEKQINDISNECVKYYFSKQNKAIYGGTLNFINPYTNQSDSINTAIFPSAPTDLENTAGTFNPQKRIISIFPYRHNIENINHDKLFNHIKEHLYHEVSHAIDPKFLIKDWWRTRSQVDYLSREEEFDAYSKQIECTIRNNINEANIENLKIWLKTNDLNLIPNCLQPHKDKIQYWQKNKPIYIQKLKQRLYNSFIGELNNVIHTTP